MREQLESVACGVNVGTLDVSPMRFGEDSLMVELMDGRAIHVPLAWYPRLSNATADQRNHWELCGAGFGIHWPELDEDLSTEGLLRGAPAPRARALNVGV